MDKMTRRGFLSGSLAAAAASAMAADGIGLRSASPAPVFGLELGLASYTFREFGLDQALTMAARLGLGRIALKDVHLPLDSPEEAIRSAIGKVKGRGLVPYGCGVVYMTSEADVDRAFAYAATGGLEIIVGVPDHGLLRLAERKARETGIRLAIHNHGPGDPLYPTPWAILDRVEGLDPRIGVCLDVGHCQRSGRDPSEAAGACGQRLFDVHLKDVTEATAAGLAIEMGRGVVDIPRFLSTLRSLDYRGTAAFEFEKDGPDPLPGLAESVGYVRGVLAGMSNDRRPV
jgi:hypothetical protein